MFGYIRLNRPEMKVKDLDLYRGYYCGLCRELRRRRGVKSQMLLSYDCTFLVLLLTGVYEPEETEKSVLCARHPAVKHTEIVNRFSPYAADMNVLLAYLKAVDDWKDERKPSARVMITTFRKDYRNLKKLWPGQERAIHDAVAGLSAEEKEPIPAGREAILRKLDRAAGYTGSFLGQMCAPYRDIWEEDLRGTGYFLGKFIYIMDAFDDVKKDRKNGNFNLLSELEKEDPEHYRETVKEVLMDTAACCCRHFERLPIVKNVEILRNILYSGIWVKFNERSV